MWLWLFVVVAVIVAHFGIKARNPIPWVATAVVILGLGYLSTTGLFDGPTQQERDNWTGIPFCTVGATPTWTFGTDDPDAAHDAVGTFQRRGWTNVTQEYNPLPGVDWLVTGHCNPQPAPASSRDCVWDNSTKEQECLCYKDGPGDYCWGA